MNWQHLFLALDGRLPRKDFWIGAGVLIGVGLICGMIPLVGSLASLALLAPWTCLTAKRLHDLGRSGWLVLIAVIPTAASAAAGLFTALAASSYATMGTAFASASLTLLVSTVALLVSLAFLLWVGLTRGQAHANAYGPAPVLAA